MHFSILSTESLYEYIGHILWNHSPIFFISLVPTKPRQSRLASEKLLHRCLLDIALLGDEFVERCNQCIHVA